MRVLRDSSRSSGSGTSPGSSTRRADGAPEAPGGADVGGIVPEKVHAGRVRRDGDHGVAEACPFEVGQVAGVERCGDAVAEEDGPAAGEPWRKLRCRVAGLDAAEESVALGALVGPAVDEVDAVEAVEEGGEIEAAQRSEPPTGLAGQRLVGIGSPAGSLADDQRLGHRISPGGGAPPGEYPFSHIAGVGLPRRSVPSPLSISITPWSKSKQE